MSEMITEGCLVVGRFGGAGSVAGATSTALRRDHTYKT